MGQGRSRDVGGGGADKQPLLRSVVKDLSSDSKKFTSDPLELQIRARVENITEINTIAQTFKAKVFLEAVIPGAAGDDGHKKRIEELYFKNFGFRNALMEEEKSREICDSGPDLLLRWRTVCTFEEEMELWDFPFDTEDLQIQFTVNNSNEGNHPVKLVPVPEASRLNCKNFALRNVWHLLPELDFCVEDTDPKESGRQHTYPLMRVVACVQRRSPYYIWNVSVPMCTFVIMSFMSYFVPAEEVADRMALSLTLVLTAAAYKFTVAGMLPAVGYSTLLDQYVLWCGFFLFLIVVEHGLCSCPPFDKHDKRSMLIIAGLFIFINLIFCIRVIHLQCKRIWHRIDVVKLRAKREHVD